MTGLRWLLIASAVVLVATVTACRPSATPSNGAQPTQLEKIAITVQDELGNESFGLGGEGSIVSRNKNAVEIANGRVIANGKDGGSLKSGDVVLLDREGRLFVNGQAQATK
ncbi:MAG: hypothetical protein ACKVP0_15210 [Pirellulaceae bacterium]